MAKCVVSIGYKNFVLESDKGVQLLDLLADAEVYEEKWNSGTKENTFHVYANDGHGSADGIALSFKVLPNRFYQMAKLAGKPVKEK